MSDLHRDPNSPYAPMQYEYEARSLWAAVALLALLVGGIVIASVYSTGDMQTAQNTPRTETTGSASPIPTMPPRE